MTFYQEQMIRIRNKIYPHDYLINQVVRAKKYMDANFADTICLEHIAGEAFYSKFHFLRLFKLVYGRTPYQYLISLRISKAKELLKTGSSIQHACFLVGFESITTFSGLFKKITGSSPSVYIDNQTHLKFAGA
jgi:AraC-like DNA-binding protein